jgi:N-acyl-D-amino-acid deacylase
MFDLIITGGTVVDGTGSPGSPADVGVTGERIEVVGDLRQSEARRVIDASGLVVSPGFIDTHAHSDAVLLVDPQHAAGLRQGITTEILGQDGLSYSPLSRENYLIYRRYLACILGEPPDDLDMSSVSAFRSHYHKKVAINTAYLVAYGAVRLETAGFHDVPLTGSALERAKRLVREGMEDGAVGLCSGLAYYPAGWSDTAEVIELCKVAQEAGGVYATHLRDLDPVRGFGGGGVPEALEIGRRSGVKVHFSHYLHYPNSVLGSWPTMVRTGVVAENTRLIDEAKADGVDCSLELYPYPSGCNFPVKYFPGYAHEGGPDAIIERLRDPIERRKLIDLLNGKLRLGTQVFTYLPKNSHLEGMSVGDVARQEGVSMGEAVIDLVLEENLDVAWRGAPPNSVALWHQVSRDSLEYLSRDDYMVGSDSVPMGSFPHPRAYGTFPRFLGRLRRQFGFPSLEQMIQRMTDNPARRFGLTGRGRLQKGYFADVVVFDAEHIIDNATYDDPRQFPSGIPYVVVNGQVAVDGELCTGVMAGQAVP